MMVIRHSDAMRTLSILALLLISGSARAEQVVVTLLATTDLHGNIYPVDYSTGKPAERGLAKIATLVRAARASNPNTLLFDCGDTMQGTPLEYVYQTTLRTGKPPLGLQPAAPLDRDPMMLAMNELAYDAMTVGNHEFNFGLANLARARSDAAFPWISANISVAAGGAGRVFAPYIVKTVAGVKVAVVGITTPAVPTWEKPENLGGYRFEPPSAALQRTVAALRAAEGPDIIIVAAHSGLGRDLKTGAPDGPAENVVYELATTSPGVDAIVYGHSHLQLAGERIGGVLVAQPRNWGMSLERLDFTMERKPDGAWSVAEKTSRLIPVTAQTPAAADILAIARPYQELAERYLDTPVATAPRELDAVLGRVEDTPLVDAVQQVQLFYSKADISFASLFHPSLKVLRGRVTVRQIAALYPYDNELYLVEGTGKMVKDALENSARYYLPCRGARCSDGPLTNREVAGFNYDMAEGVTYEIDISRPVGDRIRSLRWKGRPLAPDQKLRLAVNNYRAAGSAGYSMFIGAKVLWRSGEEIREMIVRYFTEHKRLPERADGNWRVVPEQARRALRTQAEEAARRPGFY